MKFNWLNAILATALVFLFFYFKNNARNAEAQYKNNVAALTEKVRKVNNKLGEESYKVTSLTAYNTELLEHVDAKDSVVARLQQVVKEYEDDIKSGGSVTVIHDTVFIEKTVPVYVNGDTTFFNYSDNWLTLKGQITDSLDFNLGIKNDYSIVIGYESNGLFKSKTPYTLVTNKNPYSEVKAIKSFDVKIPKQKWSIGVTGGYGIIYNQNKLYPGVGVMFGINYKLL